MSSGAGQAIHNNVWIASGAQLYGNVTIHGGSSVWPFAVIRAEATDVRIGRFTNIQDFVMLHGGLEDPVIIGDFCSIAHHATVHGATLGDACLVSINATIMDGAVIGSGSIVAAGAVVTEGSRFGPGSIVAGVPAQLIAERDATQDNRLNAWIYYRNAAAYRSGNYLAWRGPEYERWLSRAREAIQAGRDIEELSAGF